MIFAYNCSNCLMSKQHSPPSHTIFLSLQQKNLAKRVREEGLLKQLQKLLSVLRIRHHLWTACGLSMAQKKTAKFITLFGPLLEWKLLVVIKKEPKKTLHTQGRKQGRKDHSTLMCSTLGTLLPHISSPFCKAPTCKAFENVLAYLEGNTYAWISYMYKWGGSYAYL